MTCTHTLALLESFINMDKSGANPTAPPVVLHSPGHPQAPPVPRPSLPEFLSPNSSCTFLAPFPELSSATRLCWDLVIFTAAGSELFERREVFAKRADA